MTKHLQNAISFSEIVKSMGGAIIITDKDANILYVNKEFTFMTGFTEKDVIDRQPNILNSGFHDPLFFKELWESVHQTGRWEGEIYNKKKTGEVFPCWVNISSYRAKGNEVTYFVGILHDFSKKKKEEEDIQTLANRDPLTELPNRRYFLKILDRELEHAKKENLLLAVLFMDLNRFKQINDSLGHETGDEVLKGIARRLSDSIRSSDVVARLGGDEFTILLTDLQDKVNASIVSEKITEIIEKPLYIGERELQVGTSIGISIFPDDGEKGQVLMGKADSAMYRAKREGGGHQFFIDEMSKEALERLEIENDLRKAMEHNEFEVHYQPKINFHTKEVIGVEALLRWNHSEKGYIAPSKFIPIAEEIGLINSIGEWVLYTACKDRVKWGNDGFDNLVVSVNFSPKQFNKDDLIRMVKKAIKRTKINPKHLELELTESGIMDNPEYVVDVLKTLKELGVHLSIDDFGTGYSSLSHLKNFPIDTLKIDRSFIKSLRNNEEPLSSAIINLARNLNMNVIAEGVETTEQADFLESKGCSHMQGYLFSKPINESGMSQFLKTFKPQKCD